MKTTKNAIRLLLAAALALTAIPGTAETPSPRIRLFLTAGLGFPGRGADFAFQYNPNPGYLPAGSYGGQTVRVAPAAAPELQAGFILPIGRTFALRLGCAWSQAPLGGENGPFDMLFKYTAAYPPIFEPVKTSIFRTIPWPGTYGSLQEASVGLELSARWPVSSSLEISFQAGPRLLFASAQFGAIGFSEFVGGSHGAIFFRDYLLRLKLPPQTKLGWGAGIEAGLRLSAAVSLLLRAGYMTSGPYEAEPEIEAADLYWGMTPADGQTLDAIRRALVLPALTLPLGRFGLACGLALGL